MQCILRYFYCRERISKTCSTYMYTYTYIYRMYICIMTHIWLKMKIAYTKMVFRERWLMLRELKLPRYGPASWLRARFFFSTRITVSHLFDARLQPPCSCPSWKRNLNDTCLECWPLRVALRAQRKTCTDEKEIAKLAHGSRVSSLNMIDFF